MHAVLFPMGQGAPDPDNERTRAFYEAIDACRQPALRWAPDGRGAQLTRLRAGSWSRVQWLTTSLAQLNLQGAPRPPLGTAISLAGAGLLAALLAPAGFPAGTGFGMLLLILALGAMFPRRTQTGPILAELRRWQQSYRYAYYLLCAGSLPLCIADDEMWRTLFIDNCPPLLRPLAAPPRSFDDRLVYSAACWPALVKYGTGEREGLAQELRDGWSLIRKLRGGAWSFPDDLELAARLAALYDYFHGPLAEFEEG